MPMYFFLEGISSYLNISFPRMKIEKTQAELAVSVFCFACPGVSYVVDLVQMD